MAWNPKEGQNAFTHTPGMGWCGTHVAVVPFLLPLKNPVSSCQVRARVLGPFEVS
jgi:hypothetical protein